MRGTPGRQLGYFLSLQTGAIPILYRRQTGRRQADRQTGERILSVNIQPQQFNTAPQLHSTAQLSTAGYHHSEYRLVVLRSHFDYQRAGLIA
jgi:hypothetical protein